MPNELLSRAIFLIGCGQLSVLVASALVPVRLDWKRELANLPRLVRQLYWVYGGYVVLGISGLGLICLTQAGELASGTSLARAVSLFGLVFWGVRLALQTVLDAGPHLTRWWLRAGYHTLTLLFISFVAIYAWAVFQ